MAHELKPGGWIHDQTMGDSERTDDCIEIVSIKGMMWGSRQCRRYRGHGPHGLFCKQHSKNTRRCEEVAARYLSEQEPKA